MHPGLAFVDGKVRVRSRSTDINTNLHRRINLLNYLLTTTCSPSFTTCSNNAMFNMMRDTKYDARWWMQKLTTWIQLSFVVQLQVKLTKPFHNTNINCQRSLPTNDPRSSHNPKIQSKPKSLKITICFYELIIKPKIMK